MSLTPMNREFFDKMMAKSRNPEGEYKIKDRPKEVGIGFLDFLRILIKAGAIVYMVYYFLKIFTE